MQTDGHVAVDVVKGAIAGAAATWLMNQATTWMYSREGREVQQQENDARGGRSAYENAAERLASGVGLTLSDEQRSRGATSLHWGTGIAAGALYAVMRKRWPVTGAMNGLPFGTGFFLVVDELFNPLFGFTPGPRAFPWQVHARGLGGHFVYGAAMDLMLDGMDRASDLARRRSFESGHATAGSARA